MSDMTDHFPMCTYIPDSFQSVQPSRRKTRRLNTEKNIRLKDRLSHIEESTGDTNCNESFNTLTTLLGNEKKKHFDSMSVKDIENI